MYFSLDEVGSRVWRMCDGQHTVREIALTLSREYDANAETIDRDVRALLDELSREQLLHLD